MRSAEENVSHLSEHLCITEKFLNAGYQQCTHCVMDTIGDKDIKFDRLGVCNYCHEYKILEERSVIKGEDGEKALMKHVALIKKLGRGKQYDCILGISGGVDSSYLALLCKNQGLRPLLVHFDNGWNSELAVKNIERIKNYTGFDLYTYVMDWEEFRELQRSYLKASVIDIEVPTDQLIFCALNLIARKFKVKYILSGWNTVTEGVMPPSWQYRQKSDSSNLMSIHKSFSSMRLTKLPILGFWSRIANTLVYGIKTISLLEFVAYNKANVKEQLVKELGWADYGGKHYESVFTRFYQGYILPAKFKVDKRKAHLSTLICSRQITKREAILALANDPYDSKLQKEDFEFVSKKLGFTVDEMHQLIKAPIKSHYDYNTDDSSWQLYFRLVKVLSPLDTVFKFLRRPSF